MSRTWGRIAAALLVPALAFLLAGCEIRGTVDVLSDEDVAVDVTITGLGRGQCTDVGNNLSDLDVERGTNSSGTRFCRVKGVAKTEALAGLDVVMAGEYYVLELEFAGAASSWPTSDVTVNFPGQVLESSHGTVTWNSVRITDLSPFATDGLRVVALTRPGPPWWVVAGALGILAGALGALASGRFRRFSRMGSAQASTGSAARADGGSLDSGADGVPATPSPADDPPAPTVDPQFFAPPRTGGGAGIAWSGAGPPDLTWSVDAADVEPDWSEAGAAGPDGSTQDGAEPVRPRPAEDAYGPDLNEGRTATDHSVWAPPDGHGAH